jgi:hypothetical protein
VDVLETDERQARRAAKLLRLTFYPLAALLIAVLLLGRGDDAVGKAVSTKLGATTQGREFRLGVDAEGRPSRFSTQITALCPNDTTIGMPWDPDSQDGIPFRRERDRLHVAESGDGWKLSLDGTAGAGGGLRGTLSLVVHITPKRGAPYDCTSPHVRFFAGA